MTFGNRPFGPTLMSRGRDGAVGASSGPPQSPGNPVTSRDEFGSVVHGPSATVARLPHTLREPHLPLPSGIPAGSVGSTGARPATPSERRGDIADGTTDR